MTVVLNRPVVQSPVQSAALSSAQKGVQIRTPLPGPKAAALIAQDEATTSPSLGRVYDLVPKEGEGCWVTDVDGNRFLDFMAGIAVCTTGHSHPRIVKAVQEQVAIEKPFCRLIRFKRFTDDSTALEDMKNQPTVLVVAPLSGHHSTLLRDTVKALLQDHKVFITDWTDARMVSAEVGPFNLDDYVNYVQEFIRHVQGKYGNCHVMSVCQPTVPVLS